jgi:hypothetical protein
MNETAELVEMIRKAWKEMPPIGLPQCFDGWNTTDKFNATEMVDEGRDLKGRKKMIRQTRRAIYATRTLQRHDLLARNYDLAFRLMAEAKKEVMDLLAWQFKYGKGGKQWCGKKYWEPVWSPKTRHTEDRPEDWLLATLQECPMFCDLEGVLPRCAAEDGYELRAAIYGNFIYNGRSGKHGNAYKRLRYVEGRVVA